MKYRRGGKLGDFEAFRFSPEETFTRRLAIIAARSVYVSHCSDRIESRSNFDSFRKRAQNGIGLGTNG